MTIPNSEARKFWLAICASVLTAAITGLGGSLIYAGQSSEKFISVQKLAAANQVSIENIKPVVTRVSTLQSNLASTGERIETMNRKIDSLNTQITVAQTTLDKVDRMYDLLQGVDKKLSEMQITNQYVQRDMREFKSRLDKVESNQRSGK